MKILGAILAGGGSRRFGSDKAMAVVDGTQLLDRVAEGLRGQVDQLVVVGRDWPGMVSIPDRPEAAQGPLGGLCGALAHADAHGFDVVLTAGCDTLPVPHDLAIILSGQNGAVIDSQPLFGYWPTRFLGLLEEYLVSQPRRNMRGWIEHTGAAAIVSTTAFHNINTPQDQAAYLDAKSASA